MSDKKKTNIEKFKFYLHQVKVIFILTYISLVCLQLDRFGLKIEQGVFTMRDISIVSG